MSSEGGKLAFLSPEWVYEVTRVVQYARRTDEDFGRMASDFSFLKIARQVPTAFVDGH
jgi:hypothetical protein